MKEIPILFSGPMVRAILAGQKTQTRRVVMAPFCVGKRVPGPAYVTASMKTGVLMLSGGKQIEPKNIPCPYGQPGDRLWVRETFYCDDYRYPHGPAEELRALLEYRADHDCNAWEAGCPCRGDDGRSAWRPSIHMPRWASRLTLEVTEVRVQRLQEISEEDARAEGVEPVVHEHWTAYDPETEGYPSFGVEPDAETIARRRLENVRHHGPKVISTAVQQFQRLWQDINGERPGCSWQANPWAWCVSFRRAP